MTREIFWLTLTVILTGLMWIPYVLNRCQVRGLTGAMANPSRNDKPHAEWANRLMFAHDNAVENLIIFAPLVLILDFDRLFDEMDRSGLRGVFLVPARPSDRLHARPAGVPDARLHRRLLCAGRAGAGDFQNSLKSGRQRPLVRRRTASKRTRCQAAGVAHLGSMGPPAAVDVAARDNLAVRGGFDS